MSLNVRVLTVFPEMVDRALSEGMTRIAREKGVLDLRAVDVREFTTDIHRTTDDTPYGGGAGMVMMVEPIVKAWRSLTAEERGRAYIMSAKGRLFDQKLAREWSEADAVTLVCGRYEGVDERFAEHFIDEETSLGDFVLAGGEAAAASIVEGVARLLPGVVGNPDSIEGESFRHGELEEPQYTRPAVFGNWAVPDVLLSGDHARIDEWRRQQRKRRTRERRPDLSDGDS